MRRLWCRGLSRGTGCACSLTAKSREWRQEEEAAAATLDSRYISRLPLQRVLVVFLHAGIPVLGLAHLQVQLEAGARRGGADWGQGRPAPSADPRAPAFRRGRLKRES